MRFHVVDTVLGAYNPWNLMPIREKIIMTNSIISIETLSPRSGLKKSERVQDRRPRIKASVSDEKMTKKAN